MTNAELIAALNTIDGLPFFSLRSTLGTPLPYAVVLYNATNNFEADNVSYQKKQNITIELYTQAKDETTEALVESKLDALGIPWDKDELYDDGQQFYINYYNIVRR